MTGRFTVLGAGAWGTAVAVHLAKLGYAVSLWAAREESAAKLAAARENVALLPGVPIPDAVTLTHNPAEAARDADTWIVAVPTAFLRTCLNRFTHCAGSGTRCLSLTKGIEIDTFRRPSEIIAEVLGVRTVAALSGPSHAEETARGLPTSVVVGGPDGEFAADVQQAFGSPRFRVYTNRDLIGLELGGALKNVLGIAAGICDGLGFGDNAKAAMLTRGLVEMRRFGVAHGADPATFAGLAGVGDLITTCFSPHGRNRRLGERIAKGESFAEVTAGPQVAEGVYTARSVHDRITRMGLDVPIMTAVYDVLYGGKPPAEAVAGLLSRRQRGENAFLG